MDESESWPTFGSLLKDFALFQLREFSNNRTIVLGNWNKIETDLGCFVVGMTTGEPPQGMLHGFYPSLRTFELKLLSSRLSNRRSPRCWSRPGTGMCSNCIRDSLRRSPMFSASHGHFQLFHETDRFLLELLEPFCCGFQWKVSILVVSILVVSILVVSILLASIAAVSQQLAHKLSDLPFSVCNRRESFFEASVEDH